MPKMIPHSELRANVLGNYMYAVQYNVILCWNYSYVVIYADNGEYLVVANSFHKVEFHWMDPVLKLSTLIPCQLQLWD